MFKAITSVLGKSPARPEEIQKISPFIFCRYLSNSKITIQAANQLNFYYNIPIQNQYNLIYQVFGNKRIWVKYPKTLKDSSKEIDVLCEHFKISVEKAKEYLSIINKEELNTLMKMYSGIKLKG